MTHKPCLMNKDTSSTHQYPSFHNRSVTLCIFLRTKMSFFFNVAMHGGSQFT